jgi:hypothetical protein
MQMKPTFPREQNFSSEFLQTFGATPRKIEAWAE